MKRLLLTLLCFLSLSSVVIAEDLVRLHGSNLKNADFVLRYKFQIDTGLKWEKSNYEQRKSFLNGWYKKQTEDAKIAREKAKVEKARNKAIRYEQKQVKKKEMQMEKDFARIDQMELKEERKEKKEFLQKAKERDKRIKQLQKASR